MTTWNDYLNDLNDRIDLAFHAINNDEPLDQKLIDPWTPPGDLEAITPEYRDRLSETMKRYSKLELAMVHYAEDLKTSISDLAKRANTASSGSSYSENRTPTYFDQKA